MCPISKDFEISELIGLQPEGLQKIRVGGDGWSAWRRGWRDDYTRECDFEAENLSCAFQSRQYSLAIILW